MRESGENYLETILIMKQQQGNVRSVDVAEELGYSKASISRAMSHLRESGHVIMNGEDGIELTELGRRTAEAIYERHCLISQFLESTLGVDPEIAENDACRIEHILSSETFERIKAYVREHQTDVSKECRK